MNEFLVSLITFLKTYGIWFFVELFGAMFGVLAAFRLETRHERENQLKELNKMAANIYFELRDNLYEIESSIEDKKISHNFKTFYWNLYKENISKWAPREVFFISLIYDFIYVFMSWARHVSDKDFDKAYREDMIRTGNFIISILEWYEQNEELKPFLENIHAQYLSLDEFSYKKLKDFEAKYHW